ncbi:hypothetical protein FOA52_015333 [Chlamydomonas sp. UWO 241]|nr:hypothetical protein FOA52_015333 [Chlamydomonas sp. UWO 241]
MSSASKVLGGLAALGGLGYGGYYLSQSQVVGKAEQDLAQALSAVDSEKKKLKSVGKVLEETEVKHSTVVKHYEETMQAGKDIESIASRILSLKKDIERSSIAATMGEKSIVIARKEAEDARKLFNPLNHPKVKAMLGK